MNFIVSEISLSESHLLENLARIHQEIWNSTYKDIFPRPFNYISLLDSKNIWEKVFLSLQTKENILLGIKDLNNRHIVGYSFGRINEYLGFVTEIQSIGVDPKYQNKGLGRLILAETIKRLDALGGKTYLWVAEKNENAYRFYINNGLTPTTHKRNKRKSTELLFKV